MRALKPLMPLKHEQFLRVSQACFALGVVLGVVALVVALCGAQ